MEMGEKLRLARLEAGLSQRALCGGEITRNMLSLIENGSARPSMKTLQYLAARLGKPMSYFLEDSLPASPNQQQIQLARQCHDSGDWTGVLQALESCQSPDPVFGREMGLLEVLTRLALAEEAIRERREPYARELLENCPVPAYCPEVLERQRLLLLGRLRGQRVGDRLPSLDEELLLRAEEALGDGDLSRAACLLEAAQERTARWSLLRGRVWFAGKQFREAAEAFAQAEPEYPKETVPQLEVCFRELGDYEKAYFYACKARG